MSRENNEPLPSESIPDWHGPSLRSWRCSLCGGHHHEGHPHFADEDEEPVDPTGDDDE